MVKEDDLRSPGCNPRGFKSHSCQFFFAFGLIEKQTNFSEKKKLNKMEMEMFLEKERAFLKK